MHLCVLRLFPRIKNYVFVEVVVVAGAAVTALPAAAAAAAVDAAAAADAPHAGIPDVSSAPVEADLGGTRRGPVLGAMPVVLAV